MYRLRRGDDTVRSVEAVGKFLEIVVDRGLALRTHLHMNGVWHLYEQGERWRRPRHLARAVLETPITSRSATPRRPSRSGRRRTTARSPGAGPVCRTGGRRRGPRRVETADPDTGDRRGPARPATRGRDRQRVQERGPLGLPGESVHAAGRGSTPPPGAELYETAASQLQANLGRWKRQTHPSGLADLRPRRPGLSALRRSDPHHRTTARSGRRTWWCGTCQPR